jgi:hypothetical protein
MSKKLKPKNILKHQKEAPVPHPTTEEYHIKLVRFGYKSQISDQLIQVFDESTTYLAEVAEKDHHFLRGSSFPNF